MDGNVSTVQVYVYEDEKMLTVHALYVRVLPNTQQSSVIMDRPVHTRTRTRGTRTTHTRKLHVHACIAVVHTRIVVVPVAVRPRKA